MTPHWFVCFGNSRAHFREVSWSQRFMETKGLCQEKAKMISLFHLHSYHLHLFSLFRTHSPTPTFYHLQPSIFISSRLVLHTAVILFSLHSNLLWFCIFACMRECVCVCSQCVGDTRFDRLTLFLIIQQYECHLTGKCSALINNGVITVIVPQWGNHVFCCCSRSEGGGVSEVQGGESIMSH